MTPDQFRKLALGQPLDEEGEHMDHPDFRIGGKVFASLSADGFFGVVKLRPAQQAAAIARNPEVFTTAAGAWGKRGYTRIALKHAKQRAVRLALTMAWHNSAPKKIATAFSRSIPRSSVDGTGL